MKNPACQAKYTFGRIDGEVVLNGEFAAENPSFVWSADGSFDFGLDVGEVGFIDYHFDAYLDRSTPTIRALLLAGLHLLADCVLHQIIHFG